MTIFQDDTLQADDRAFFLQVRDVVQSALSEATFPQVAAKMHKTMGIELKGSPVKTVEVLRQRYTLTEAEGDGVLRHLITGGDLAGYGLINASDTDQPGGGRLRPGHRVRSVGRSKLVELSSREWKGLPKRLEPLNSWRTRDAESACSPPVLFHPRGNTCASIRGRPRRSQHLSTTEFPAGEQAPLLMEKTHAP